jgi:hypothetical protein
MGAKCPEVTRYKQSTNYAVSGVTESYILIGVSHRALQDVPQYFQDEAQLKVIDGWR